MTIEMNVTYCTLQGVAGLQGMLYTFANFLLKLLGQVDKLYNSDSFEILIKRSYLHFKTILLRLMSK